MENLTLYALRHHKQREETLMEEARIERFLSQKKRREACAWMQRRPQRHRRAV